MGYRHLTTRERYLIVAHKSMGLSLRQTGGQIPGIGPITTSAPVATVGNFNQFASGGQFGCWIGLTPSQDSSGGKTRLGRITKRGDTYLRTLLIQAAKSAVMTADKRSDPISQ